MDVRELMTNLALRVEDPEEGTFTEAMRLKALNNGQIKAAAFLHDNYLDELRVKEINKTLTSNVLAFSGLSYTVLRGEQGILKVKITGGRYSTRIDLSDIKKTENSLLASKNSNPLHYIYQSQIEMLHSVTAIDVWYLRMPNPLLFSFNMTQEGTPSTTVFHVAEADDAGLSESNDAYNGTTDPERAVIYCVDTDSYHVVTDYVGSSKTFTVSPALSGTARFTTGYSFRFVSHDWDKLQLDGVYPDLNASLHELILTFAEAELWRMDKKADRSEEARKAALSEVEVLNAKFKPAEGIGTKGRS